MSCTAKHGIQGTAEGTFKPVTIELAAVLHMPNGRFDGTAPSDHGFEPKCHTSFWPRSSDLHMLAIHLLTAAVDEDHFRLDVG